MDVQNILIQLFEEAGYHREKQVRMTMHHIDPLVGPAPGTYRFDGMYNKHTNYSQAYLTTRSGADFLEFVVNGVNITVWEGLTPTNLNLSDPNSIDAIQKLISYDA